MFKKIISALLLFFALFFSAAFAENTELLLKSGKKLLNKNTAQSAKEAVDLFKNILLNEPENYDALQKTGESYYYFGKFETSPEKQRQYFHKCIEFNKKAIAVKSDKADAHYWLGICYAKHGKASGVIKSFAMLDDVKYEMNRVLSIEPSFSHGGAYRVLGRIYYKLPWIIGGNKKRSLVYLKKAVEYGPDYSMNHLFLAETYLSLGKRESAIGELKLVLRYTSLQNKLSDEEKEIREKAEEILKDIR